MHFMWAKSGRGFNGFFVHLNINVVKPVLVSTYNPNGTHIPSFVLTDGWFLKFNDEFIYLYYSIDKHT